MSTVHMTHVGRLLLSSAVATVIAGTGVAYAQVPPPAGSTVEGSPAGPLSASPSGPATTQAPPPAPDSPTNSPNAEVLQGPGFQLNANVSLSELYVNNPAGIAGQSRSDYMSTPGFAADLHEHSARITLDANYSFFGYFYAQGTVPTQIDNTLRAVGKIDVVPEYLDLDLRAFAQPVMTSNFGVVSAGNTVVPGSFNNSYGYYETPDLHFNWGDFATFKTMPSVGQVFFTVPAGTSAANTIPGIPGPENTTIRSVVEEISSGTDFEF